MPPPVRLSRNITDFFKPFSQPRDVPSTQGDLRKETKQDERIARSSGPTKGTHNDGRSRGPQRMDRRSENLPSANDNASTVGQVQEVVDRRYQVSGAFQTVGPALDVGTLHDEVRSSSLSTVSSQSSLPMENPKPASKARNSCESTMQVKAEPTRSFGEDPFILGSQRVVRNGEVVIANSDEDTDSQDSLEGLDQLFDMPKKASLMCRSSLQPDPATASSYALRSQNLREKKIKSSYSLKDAASSTKQIGENARTATKPHRFSLQILVAQTVADRAIEAAAQQAEVSLKSMEDEQTALGQRHNGILEGEAELLMKNVDLGDGDGDSTDQLLRAVRRSEVLQQEHTSSFFNTSTFHLDRDKPKFPHCSIDSKWVSRMQVSTLREQAFLSGFVGEVASKGRLQTEILQWVTHAICVESSHILRNAYFMTLSAAAEQTARISSPKVIKQMFSELGANEEALDLRIPAKPTMNFPSSDRKPQIVSDWSKLISVLKLLGGIAKQMDTDTRIYTTCLMCRMALDKAAMRDAHVVVAFEDTISKLLESVLPLDFEHEKLLLHVTSLVEDRQLQTLLLQSLPASSIRLSILRRRLALAWFFRDNGYLALDPQRPHLFSEIMNTLTEPDLDIHPSTDFFHLSTSIKLLDVVVGDGDPPQSSDGPKDTTKAFNKEVDRLAIALKGMTANINDTRSANLARAEAKDLLETLSSRLAYTVRTKPKPRKDMFEGSKQLPRQGPKGSIGRMDEFVVRQPQDEQITDPKGAEEAQNDSELLQYQWEQELAKEL